VPLKARQRRAVLWAGASWMYAWGCVAAVENYPDYDSFITAHTSSLTPLPFDISAITVIGEKHQQPIVRGLHVL
jgi:hypothetical protein